MPGQEVQWGSVDARVRELVNRGRPLAALRHENRVYWATAAEHLPGGHAPETPVSRLIQGLYARYPRLARKKVRNRIFMAGEKTAYCEGAMKVAAKRMTVFSNPAEVVQALGDSSAIWEEVLSVLPQAPEPFVGDGFVSLSQAQARCEQGEGAIQRASHRRFLSDRPVAALLLSAKGEVLAEATNRGSENRTLHAEVALIHSWWSRSKERLPEGAQVLTTLKPCKMCAGLLVWYCENPQLLRVSYRDFDPGPFGRQTILDAMPGVQEPWKR
jgi:hypothetical protein